jgi:hypothetical protein
LQDPAPPQLVAGVLDVLGGGGEREGLPAGDRGERLQEPGGGVGGLHDLGGGSPALRRPLLEQAEAAGQVAEPGFLHRGGDGDGDDRRALRQLHARGDAVDDLGVGDLRGGEGSPVDRLACRRA